jgi:hypothetical protein
MSKPIYRRRSLLAALTGHPQPARVAGFVELGRGFHAPGPVGAWHNLQRYSVDARRPLVLRPARRQAVAAMVAQVARSHRNVGSFKHRPGQWVKGAGGRFVGAR